jgi:uncharacterized protein involved in response to NO
MQKFWTTFSAAPHRMMFLAGALQLLLAMGLWLLILLERHALVALPMRALPDFALHGYLMIFTLFPCFMFGFLMTTYPRWMSGTEVPRGHYVPTFLWLAAGIVLFYPLLFVGAVATAIAMACVAIGWLLAYRALWTVYRAAPSDDKRYERHLNVALGIAIAIQLLLIVALLDGRLGWYAPLLQLGFWLFLIPLLLVVAHRMVPFFASCVLDNYTIYRPVWGLWAIWAGCALHWTADQWSLWGVRAVVDLAFAAILALHLWHWSSRRFGDRLLGVLFLALALLVAGVALSGVQAAWMEITGDWILGVGPMHLIAIGFVAALALGMVSRVTLGHSGRALDLDQLAWFSFLGLQLVAVLRVLGEVSALRALVDLNLIAAIGWLLCVLPWVLRYAPRYLRVRVDGRPG